MQETVHITRAFAPVLMAASLFLGACSNGQHQVSEEEASGFLYDNTVGLVENTFLTASWRQIDSMAELNTKTVMQAYAMDFIPGSTSISEGERTRLLAFLRSKGIQRGDRIQLDGLRTDDNELLPETIERIEVLRLELANYGLQAQAATTPITIQLAPDDRVALIVTRTLVLLPDCATDQPARGDRPVRLRNCANKTHLGMMVANPADLQRGSPGGYSDGTASVLSIERYRAGEIIPLDEILATKEVEQE